MTSRSVSIVFISSSLLGTAAPSGPRLSFSCTLRAQGGGEEEEEEREEEEEEEEDEVNVTGTEEQRRGGKGRAGWRKWSRRWKEEGRRRGVNDTGRGGKEGREGRGSKGGD